MERKERTMGLFRGRLTSHVRKTMASLSGSHKYVFTYVLKSSSENLLFKLVLRPVMILAELAKLFFGPNLEVFHYFLEHFEYQ